LITNKKIPLLGRKYNQDCFKNNSPTVSVVPQTHQGEYIPKVHNDVPARLILLDLTPLRILFMTLYSRNQGRSAYAPEDILLNSNYFINDL